MVEIKIASENEYKISTDGIPFKTDDAINDGQNDITISRLGV